MFRYLLLSSSIIALAMGLPHFRSSTEDSRHFAMTVHRANAEEIKKFQMRLEEQELNSQYGPAFADSYSYQERVRVANILRTIRALHKFGNY